MSRLLVTCWPFVGHVLPQLGIAAALRERGAEVAFYTGGGARELLERERFPLFGFERVDERAVVASVAALERSAGSGRPRLGDVQRCFRSWLLDTIPAQLADLDGVIADWRPDAIVCDVALWAPTMVLAERTPIPVALSTIFMGPPAGAPDVPPQGLGLPSPKRPAQRAIALAVRRASELFARGLRRSLDELRARNGLAPLGRSINEHMARMPLTIVPSIRELDYGRRRVPTGVHYVGECRPPSSAHRDEQAGLLEHIPEDRPWVHVTGATMPGSEPFLLAAAAEGLGDREMEVVVSTGTGGEATAAGWPAANLHAAPWVDHDTLLPRCSVVVTPGGTGTVVAALASGVPLVVVPTAWDKPDNAQRVVEAGVGVRLSPRRCTPERLRAAVERVLGDPRYRENARGVASLLAAAPGPHGAARLLEGLVAAPAARTAARPVLGGAG